MNRTWLALIPLVPCLLSTSAVAEPPPVRRAPSPMEATCIERDQFFADEVWAKVGERICLNCHTKNGDASGTTFLLEDATRDPAALARNKKAFEAMATRTWKDSSWLLLKVSNRKKHGGGEVVKYDTRAYRILDKFVDQASGHFEPFVGPPDYVPGPYFAGVTSATPQRLLRRVTLSLAGRLPTAAEKDAVEKTGHDGIPPILDAVMKEEAFYARLREGFNDIFLTNGYPGSADDALSYDHFEKSRHWYQKHDLSHVPEKDRKQAGYKLANDYRQALLREPLELVAHIVRKEKPFTELVTADYIMVSPYSSRGYGIFDKVKDQFRNVDDPFEYVPAKLPALKNRAGKTQPSDTGFYPHAGILTTFQYLRRYPTTVTNRNRLRSRMYYSHFLGIDVMALAPRVTDAAAVSKKFKTPTMEASECVVCHKTVDPVAGLFQDYFNEEGHYGPRKEGWFTDMFQAGLEGSDLPKGEKWRSLQWLGAETAKDPRFAVAMVEHVYYLLMGRRPLPAPLDIEDPLYTPKRRAYIEQRKAIHDIAEKFAKANFNLKVVFQALVASPFYRADGLAEAAKHPARRAELDDIGLVHMLTPEQLERKIEAVFGKKWGRLGLGDGQMGILYGGIDSKEVTQRATDPSGAMGAIQRIMANDTACRNVAVDFDRPAKERRLFPSIEPSVVPGTLDADKQIRATVVHLHDYLLGRKLPLDHPDVNRAVDLFTGIVTEAAGKKGLNSRETYHCQAEPNKKPTDDPKYTIRAWRAVVTYLLRQDEFLYE